MKRVRYPNRRATVLLMVVSVLALLFVIMTGFLTVARFYQIGRNDVHEAEAVDTIIDQVRSEVSSLMASAMKDSAGLINSGGAMHGSFATIPGTGENSWLASNEPVRRLGVTGVTATTNLPPGGDWDLLAKLQWPAVTDLRADRAARPRPTPIYQLMLENDLDSGAKEFQFDTDDVRQFARVPFMDADGDGIPDAGFLSLGRLIETANAIAGTPVDVPENDANPLTRFNSFAIPRPDTTDPLDQRRRAMWDRFNQNARYEVALRVISHGGMVTLDSPTQRGFNTTIQPWNRQFTLDLFDSVRNDQADRRTMNGMNPRRRNEMFDDLEAYRGPVEAALRRRGGLLPGAQIQDAGGSFRRVPPVLAFLEDDENRGRGFRGTFIPGTGAIQGPGQSLFGSGQRINIADESQQFGGSVRRLWSNAMFLRPDVYNESGTAGGFRQVVGQYDRRHLITTVNNSDELARKLGPKEPTFAPGDGRVTNLETFRGELKFYLGEIPKAFMPVTAAGIPAAGFTGMYRYNRPVGDLIVERLARLYYDMLGGHDMLDGKPNNPWRSVMLPKLASPPDHEAVNRRQQAFMLAVNTVAFAFPRDTAGVRPGFMDVVYYHDDPNPMDPTRAIEYVGYAPQPFFSEVISYRRADTDPNDPNVSSDPSDPAYADPNRPNVAIAVELFNPHDPYFQPGALDDFGQIDLFALRLDQFAISVDGRNPNDTATYQRGTDWAPLDDFYVNTVGATPRLNGRSFGKFVIEMENGRNRHFGNILDPGQQSVTLSIPRSTAGSLKSNVTLDLWRWGWRRNPATGVPHKYWVKVDSIELWDTSSTPNANDWVGVHRDTSPTREYAGVRNPATGQMPLARWSVPTLERSSGRVGGAPPLTPETIGVAAWLGVDSGGSTVALDPDTDPGAANFARPFSPKTPLITMNAGADMETVGNIPLWQRFNNLPMFGNKNDLRPRSFPTPGFALFVPRFSHVERVIDGMATRSIPVSDVLEKQWDNRGHTIGTVLAPGYPADFGHMPIFDNTQKGQQGGYFDSKTGVGHLPWGLLVFDYLTTLNPNMDLDGDGRADVDPLRVPGRININTAPWFMLAQLPLLGPTDETTAFPHATVNPAVVDRAELPIRWRNGNMRRGVVDRADPSPAFWDPRAGVLVGQGGFNLPGATVPNQFTFRRTLMNVGAYKQGALYGRSVPWLPDGNNTSNDVNRGRYRLGPWLAEAAASYRDGIQIIPLATTNGASKIWSVYAQGFLRNATGFSVFGPQDFDIALSRPYRAARYGSIRGSGQVSVPLGETVARPSQLGFISVGELLNVIGFDSSRHRQLPFGGGSAFSTLQRGDFVKAVSLGALLDSHYMTTRSNTFTAYASVIDRKNPQNSVRSQITFDRSNLLPRLTYLPYQPQGAAKGWKSVNNPNSALPLRPVFSPPVLGDSFAPGVVTPLMTANDNATAEIISERRIGYFNTRFDD